jgi:hypothetical protein
MAKQLIKEAYRMQQLAGLINENYVDLMPINSPFMEGEEEDDMEDVESDEEEYDFNAPGKKDEFDTDDDIEPTAKDVKAGDALAKTVGGKQAKLNMLEKERDTKLNAFKAATKGLDRESPEFKMAIADYKGKIKDIPMQIQKLKAELNPDISIDDEDEY